MLSSSIALAALIFAGASAHRGDVARRDVLGPGSTNGTNNGFFYEIYNQGGGIVKYTNGKAGQYSVQWSDVDDFIAGKGWATGSARNITFAAQYISGANSSSPAGGGSLSVYGWSENPLVEYYIMEDYPAAPIGQEMVGTVTSDGSTYTIYKSIVNEVSYLGSPPTHWRYMSVRSSPRTNGTVTVGNHFNAWKRCDLSLGQLNYQILATESYGGATGSANVTVS